MADWRQYEQAVADAVAEHPEQVCPCGHHLVAHEVTPDMPEPWCLLCGCDAYAGPTPTDEDESHG